MFQLLEHDCSNRESWWANEQPTLPKFNSSPLKNDAWKTTFLLWWYIFGCYVKLPGSRWLISLRKDEQRGDWAPTRLITVSLFAIKLSLFVHFFFPHGSIIYYKHQHHFSIWRLRLALPVLRRYHGRDGCRWMLKLISKWTTGDWTKQHGEYGMILYVIFQYCTVINVSICVHHTSISWNYFDCWVLYLYMI